MRNKLPNTNDLARFVSSQMVAATKPAIKQAFEEYISAMKDEDGIPNEANIVPLAGNEKVPATNDEAYFNVLSSGRSYVDHVVLPTGKTFERSGETRGFGWKYIEETGGPSQSEIHHALRNVKQVLPGPRGSYTIYVGRGPDGGRITIWVRDTMIVAAADGKHTGPPRGAT